MRRRRRAASRDAAFCHRHAEGKGRGGARENRRGVTPKGFLRRPRSRYLVGHAAQVFDRLRIFAADNGLAITRRTKWIDMAGRSWLRHAEKSPSADAGDNFMHTDCVVPKCVVNHAKQGGTASYPRPLPILVNSLGS
jgi:hypothetical protein